MENVYERIVYLCKRREITPGRMCNDLGISRSTVSDLKSGRKQTVTVETASKIADYFGVPITEVIGDSKETGSEPFDMGMYLGEMRERLMTEDTLLFNGKPMSPEAMQSVLNAMEIGMRMVLEKEVREAKEKEREDRKKGK